MVAPAILTLLGAYFGLYAVMEARHERRLNRAAFERSAFTDLVTSNNRGSFVAAMKRFGPVQTMEVPTEPRILEPWDWWDEPDRPNREPLHSWARHFFPLCTAELCGHPTHQGGDNKYKGIGALYVKLDKIGRIDLRGANLRGAYLIDSNLRGADFSTADLSSSDLHGADLLGAYLIDSNLRGANLRGVYLIDSDLSSADLRGADLSSADLRSANLSDADLIDSNLRGAGLIDAYLSGADLSSAYLGSSDLRGADLRGADLRHIKYDAAPLWPAGFTPPPSR